MKIHYSAKSSQKGAVFVLFTIAMVVIIAVAGLALDVSHAYINKTQLQNALDAAALSGAMTLNKLGDSASAQQDATNDAKQTFSNDLEQDLNGLVPTIEFSGTIDPFQPGVGTARYVRARVETHTTTAWLLKVLGRDFLGVRASAVAGPVDINPCKVGPFVVCGDLSQGCPDANNCYGYKVDEPGEQDPQECYIKVGSQGGGNEEYDADLCGADLAWGNSQVGPGNFHFKQYESCSNANGKGKPCMVESLGIGANNQCAEANNGYVDTQTGNIVSIRDAFNTIFGISGKGKKYPPEEFPPDTDTSLGIFYDEYDGNGRRIMPVVIANCDADPDNECAASDYQFKDNSGGTQCLPKLTVGCFFLTRPLPVPGDGGLGNTSIVYGQFIGECPSYGEKTLTPNPVYDINKIILYKDSPSKDS